MTDSAEKLRKGRGGEGKRSVRKWTFEPTILSYECDDFIVGLDDELDVDWQTSDAFDIRRGADPHRTLEAKVTNRVIELQALPMSGFDDRDVIAFRRGVAEGLVQALQGQFDSANNVLDSAKSTYDATVQRVTKIDSQLTARYEAQVKTWQGLGTALRVAQVLLGTIGIVAQIAATAANRVHDDGSWANARMACSVIAAVAVGVLYAFGIGPKSNRYGEAWRLLRVELDRFAAGQRSRDDLISAYELGERRIGGVDFMPRVGDVASMEPVEKTKSGALKGK
ncbi:MAG: hypothetical protein ACHREM_06475 [Polyangiales bacterium]